MQPQQVPLKGIVVGVTLYKNDGVKRLLVEGATGDRNSQNLATVDAQYDVQPGDYISEFHVQGASHPTLLWSRTGKFINMSIARLGDVRPLGNRVL